MFDRVTGLVAPPLFLDRVEMALARAGRVRAYAAVLFFRHVHSFPAQSRELSDLARRFRSELRADDSVGRMGELDFGVVCQEVESRRDGIEIGQRLLRRASSVCSVGVALGRFPERAEELTLRAIVVTEAARPGHLVVAPSADLTSGGADPAARLRAL